MFMGIFYYGLFKKIAASLTMASIRCRNLLQALAMVFLGGLAMTSVIFAFREATVLWGFLFTSLSQTLQM
jgi:hypothetical protein